MNFSVFLILCLLNNLEAKGSVKSILRSSIQTCKTEIENGNQINIEKSDKKILKKLRLKYELNARKGFAIISGGFPTCGCTCSVESAVFKSKDSSYTNLINEKWSCSYKRKSFSNKKINHLIPIQAQQFTGINTLKKKDFKNFYLDVKPPKIGTTIEVELKLTPLGMTPKNCHNQFCFEISQDTSKLFEFDEKTLKNISLKSLLALKEKKYQSIEKSDLELIKLSYPKDKATDTALNRLSFQTQKIYKVYESYKKIKYSSALFTWNRNKKSFEFYKSSKLNDHGTFQDFIRQSEYWLALC